MERFEGCRKSEERLKVDSFVEALSCGRCWLPAEHGGACWTGEEVSRRLTA
ncbi:MAG: hypothetical protein ACTS5R_00950 [Candidatus Hodgkinia cicadicola]